MEVSKSIDIEPLELSEVSLQKMLSLSIHTSTTGIQKIIDNKNLVANMVLNVSSHIKPSEIMLSDPQTIISNENELEAEMIHRFISAQVAQINRTNLKESGNSRLGWAGGFHRSPDGLLVEAITIWYTPSESLFKLLKTKPEHAYIYDFLVKQLSKHKSVLQAIGEDFTPIEIVEFIEQFGDASPLVIDV